MLTCFPCSFLSAIHDWVARMTVSGWRVTKMNRRFNFCARAKLASESESGIISSALCTVMGQRFACAPSRCSPLAARPNRVGCAHHKEAHALSALLTAQVGEEHATEEAYFSL